MYEQASSIPAWMETMESEIQVLQANDTWDLVLHPQMHQSLGVNVYVLLN